MRAGISLSAGLHAGVLAIALVGLPSLFDPAPPAEMLVAVTVVAEAAEPEPKPQPPKPEPPKPEPPKPEPPKPEPPKSEPPKPEPPPPAPPPPEPPPPPPEPVPPPPPPEPEPPPPEPKPEPKPAPKPESKPAEPPPPPPQAKPKPVPRQVAKAVPAPRRKPKPPPDAFDTLLRDLERQRKKAAEVPPATTPRRQADSSPSPARQLQAGLQQQRLVAALVRQIRERVRPCWNPPIGIKDAHKIQVGIRIVLNTDGTLIGRPRIVDQQRLAADPVFRAYAESAVRALQNPRCSPLRLPLDSYSAWRSISFNFDTRELLQ